MQWVIPVISALGRYKWKSQEFKATLGYIMSCLKKKRKKSGVR